MRIQEIYGILDELEDLYAIPFIMYFEGYAYKEIAGYLARPIGTVKSRLHTARKLLQKKALPETV